MKRRKRTNANVPAKGRLREMADQLWSLAVRRIWRLCCAMCGDGKPDAHHLVPRGYEATRYALHNGIALCPHCHKFDKEKAPHMNAAGFLAWLRREYPQVAGWYEADPRPAFVGTKNAPHYIAIIKALRNQVPEEDFVRIVGKKFAEWLEQ